MFFSFALHALVAAIVASPSPSPVPVIAHVVTADRSDETLHNAIRTTYIVTAADIARNGYQTVAQALTDVPGVNIASYGPLGAAASYGIRGSSSAQTLVLVDGVPAPGGLANSPSLSAMSTAGVARIEVVEGGGSTLFGQGAIGGIINVITTPQERTSASIAYGTFDQRTIALTSNGFSFSHTNAANTFALPPSVSDGSANPTERADGDYATSQLRYGLDRSVGSLHLALRSYVESDDLGAPGAFPAYSLSSREHDVNDDASLQISQNRAQSQISATLFGTRELITFSCDATSDANCGQTSPSFSSEGRSGLSVRDVVSGNDERTIFGADFSRGVVFTNDGYGDPVTQNALSESAAYVQTSHTFAHSEFYAGLRGERDGSLGGEFSPSLGARFDLSQAVALKLNVADAFRAPNASELYYPNYGNPNLVAERAVVGDASLVDTHLLGGATLEWFTQDARDLIVANPANNYIPANIASAAIAGFTFDIATPQQRGLSSDLAITDLYQAQNLSADTRLPLDPVLTGTLGLKYTGNAASWLRDFGISEHFVGSREPYDAMQPSFDQAVPYANLHAYVHVRLARAVELGIEGDNLGNERYAEVPDFPMPGRTIQFELRTP